MINRRGAVVNRLLVHCATALFLAVFALHLFCTKSSDNIVSGNSSETTDAVAYAYKADGTPAQGAKFAFVKEEGWFENLVSSLPIVVDSGFVGAGGRIEFLRSKVEECNIQIDDESQGALVNSASDLLDTDTIRLEPFRRLEGSVVGAEVEKLYLEGTSYASDVIEGEFIFDKICAGNFPVVAKLGGEQDGYYYTSAVDLDSDRQNLLVHSERITYDDFDDGDLNPALMDVLQGSSWFWISSDNAELYQPSGDSSLHEALEQGEHGLCIRTRFGSRGGADVYRVQVSSFLNSTRMLNLSSLDSIIVYARGNCELTLALERAPEGEVAVKAGYVLDVTDEWTRFAIDPNDATLSEYDVTMRPWDEIKDQVNMITIFGQNGDEFWVDEIQFVGLDFEELQ